MKKRIHLIAIVALLSLTTACKKDSTTENNSGTDTIAVKQPEANMNQVPVVQAANGKFAVMTFDHDVHDFGTIQQGDKPTYDFAFKNTGEADLIITNAQASCGCTVPSCPKDPIMPGKKGKIEIKYNMAPGPIRKTITVESNAVNVDGGRVALKIKGEVITN